MEPDPEYVAYVRERFRELASIDPAGLRAVAADLRRAIADAGLEVHYPGLHAMLAILVLTRGTDIDSQAVHDAWAASCTWDAHWSLREFDELHERVQRIDDAYAEVARGVARRHARADAHPAVLLVTRPGVGLTLAARVERERLLLVSDAEHRALHDPAALVAAFAAHARRRLDAADRAAVVAALGGRPALVVAHAEIRGAHRLVVRRDGRDVAWIAHDVRHRHPEPAFDAFVARVRLALEQALRAGRPPHPR